MASHPETVPLLRRTFHKGARSSVRDQAQLAAWVTHTVMTAPTWRGPWDDWPPRFTHCQPHRDLSDFVRI